MPQRPRPRRPAARRPSSRCEQWSVGAGRGDRGETEGALAPEAAAKPKRAAKPKAAATEAVDEVAPASKAKPAAAKATPAAAKAKRGCEA